jgi:hypothetical protein
VDPAPLDQLAILKLVTSRLDAQDLPYMVTGSIASGHYGQPRMTRDIDIVIEAIPPDAEKLAMALGQEFLPDPDSFRAAISRRGFFNVIHRDAIVKVDFIVRKNDAYRRQEFERRRRVSVDGHPLWLVAPEDLILSKLVWSKDTHSELQRRDVRALLKFQHDALDREYLHRWADALSVRTLLTEMTS